VVTLSACETGLEKFAGGEGHLGFAQALLIAGARRLVLSLWKVDDTATALLMSRFYQNLLGRREGLDAPMPKGRALQEAKCWLRNLSVAEVTRLKAQLLGRTRGPEPTAARPPGAVRPYAHPFYWAAFILVGDPGDLAPEPGSRSPADEPTALVLTSGSLLVCGTLLFIVFARRRARPRSGGSFTRATGQRRS
jgi:CHAT domain-containing protein